MVADIQRLESAARIAMGGFEDVQARPRPVRHSKLANLCVLAAFVAVAASMSVLL
jgi:hypothetical protein